VCLGFLVESFNLLLIIIINLDLLPSASQTARISSDSEATVKDVMLLLQLVIQKHHLTQAAGDDILSVVRSLHPHSLTQSAWKARQSLLKRNRLEMKKIPLCRNDCTLFADYDYDVVSNSKKVKNAAKMSCDVCGLPKLDSSGKPHHFYIYFPLIPQLKTMRESIPQLPERPAGSGEEIRNVWESPGWKEAVHEDPTGFGNDRNNIALLFCTDGAPPFKKSTITIWPHIFRILNYPDTLAKSVDKMIITGFSGPATPKRLDLHLALVVDELLQLWHGKSDAGFRVKVIQVVADNPGLNKIIGTAGHVAMHGCVWCTDECEQLLNRKVTLILVSISVHILCKWCWVGGFLVTFI
jgi:hypothetical protein